ncbi:homocitrate synthase/isopropylmalate synthase family protein [Pectinatus haikarae]|uniref:Homocitrate synthase NifV n=1 Tax=Pectinatus haikarae TaxID=349096 RepID=A0ABT9Y508_9FIRM|nr:hypothetical protein [Pectinatus haikarae]MDQ0202912.1 homocitrate synthase NifV [Pectinatus haikarae]
MITDATLCYVDTASKWQQKLILKCLERLPVDAVEMTVPVWQNIADMAVLPAQKYILRINDYEDIWHYKGAYRYVLTAKEYAAAKKQLIRQNVYNASGKKIETRIIGLTRLSVLDIEAIFTHWSGEQKPVSFEPFDSLNQATALAFAWHKRGQQAVTSFCGIADHAPLEEILLAAHLAGIVPMREKMNFRLLKKIVSAVLGISIPVNKPVIGDAIFAVESGIHVDGIMKNPQLYEPYPPEFINAKRRIILGSTSGRKAVEVKLKELKLSCRRLDTAAILEKVKEKSRILCRSLTDKEFYDLVEMMGRV